MAKFMILTLSFFTAISVSAAPEFKSADETNMIEELNPFDVNIEEQLLQMDAEYERETGMSAHLEEDESLEPEKAYCFRENCAVWIYVSKGSQTLTLYRDGYNQGSWPVSTGISGFGTPDFDRHPNGRIYTRYTSTRYPEGDYNGLGNMPYAIFIEGGFAIHGTPRGNWSRLGRPASHGCVRVHPEAAQYLNRLVRSYGTRHTWITVR